LSIINFDLELMLLKDKEEIGKLEILYQDESLIAINKPHGLLVHRTKLANDASEFVVQILRDQLDRYVYPIHRLDRKTGGALLLALNEEFHKEMQSMFAEKRIDKTYHAIVRGFTDDSGTIDYSLRNESGKIQDAVTHYRTLGRYEIPVPFGKHSSSRYSLVEVKPETGRMHQIRKHMAHILHPIVADRPHGCNKQNKLFKEKWNMTTMMLHATELAFIHPVMNKETRIEATKHSEFKRVIQFLNKHTFIHSL